MAFSNDRERHNDEVIREHKAALARGEKRVLRHTKDQGLRSYPADEIGFSPGRGHPQVSTWWGMGILFTFMVLLGLGTLVVLFVVLANGGPAPWGILVVTAFAALLSWYFFGMARDEYRARKLRRNRGTPEPSDR
ncbi:hypothetical protein [Arthrobacter woluwensis]|uniref:Uncharacterized protein n=1 Tax=Arthrobacter woluwensis TaxID=156980 RepID=A0A1H4LX78_9MICC|nr:hypothetical protein [Arthrobacter woluwensis]SEB75379.1 hypothetical protein SAMN04489745_1158 [Arthrobacter woluwensis]